MKASDAEPDDTLVDELQGLKEKLPKVVAKCHLEIEQARKQLLELDEKLQKQEAQRQQLAYEIKHDQERLQKSQTRLMNIRTNEEYQAVQKEIENLTEASSKRETQQLLIMEKIEELQKYRLESQEFEKATLERVNQLEQNSAQQLQEAEMTLETILPERQTIAEKIVDKKLLHLYEALRKKIPLAVVQIDRPFCEGCRMTLPPQFFNTLVSLKSICQCPSCFRILYWRVGEDLGSNVIVKKTGKK
jgi:predicted  nucleic acid-binding Zn-ribbon protein